MPYRSRYENEMCEMMAKGYVWVDGRRGWVLAEDVRRDAVARRVRRGKRWRRWWVRWFSCGVGEVSAGGFMVILFLGSLGVGLLLLAMYRDSRGPSSYGCDLGFFRYVWFVLTGARQEGGVS